MKRLRIEKLHVRYFAGARRDFPLVPRRYTLTHSDFTGDLYLTIGLEFERNQVSQWYTRLMRDEVLAEWTALQQDFALRVHCHVSGGLLLGWPRLRYTIFRRELPLALEALRWGDRALFDKHPGLDSASVLVHFHASQQRYNVTEEWGPLGSYR